MSDSEQPKANVKWSEKGQPISTHYGDMYFSIADGLAESRYVFLEQNQLASRFSTLTDNEHFTIGETGFGTGLNFLTTWECWLEHAPSQAHLHFISTEKYPLSYQELSQSLQLWPSLQTLAEQLLAEYKMQFIGSNEPHFYRFNFGRITLTLIVDDVTQALKQLLPQQHNDFIKPLWSGVDAWFLDGFSPAKNPDMWTDDLLYIIALLSKKGSTLATYTAASAVKIVLEDNGFNIKKQAGFGKKRELITASFKGKSHLKSKNILKKNQTPWAYNHSLNEKKSPQKIGDKSIAIIGAGLAGCHTAYALAQKGFKVDIFECNQSIANEASGNPQAMLYTKLSANKEPLAEFNLACQLNAQAFYTHFWEQCSDSSHGEQCGLLQLTDDKNSQKKQQLLSQRFQHAHFLKKSSPKQSSDLTGIAVDHSGLYLPYSGWINPLALCNWLTKHSNITVHTSTRVNHIKATPKHQWELSIGNGNKESTNKPIFSAVVICNAHAAKQFSQTAWLPTNALRGQISYITSRAPLDNLKTVVTGQNYIAPAPKNSSTTNHFHTIGASYDLHNTHKELTQDEHHQNIAQLNKLIPITEQDPPTIIGGRANLRCTSPDYLPLVGCVPDRKEFIEQYFSLAYAARKSINNSSEYLPNLFLNTGHGSRGLAYTPMAAEIIACQLTGTLAPLPQQLVDAINPARFIIRSIKNRSFH